MGLAHSLPAVRHYGHPASQARG
ncbi:MAG: hypothetical protein JWO26_3492, partial [Rhodospirillales bacterium]|nr:hypothetical protein [Rhodospirillales bacterium]